MESEQKTQHMLTTVDNPFNPFTQFQEWFAYDEAAGYHTLGYLARVCYTSDEMSDADRALVVETAIDEIITENVSGMHKKVPDPRTTSPTV